jgi:hypothetical protein
MSLFMGTSFDDRPSSGLISVPTRDVGKETRHAEGAGGFALLALSSVSGIEF